MQLVPSVYRKNDDPPPAPLALPPGPTTQTRERMIALTRAWSGDGRGTSRGASFSRALETYFAGIPNPNTRRAYAYALLEFWDWLRASTGGEVPVPDRIERRTAMLYAEWLRTRAVGLEQFRLEEAARGAVTVREYGASTLRLPEVIAAIYVVVQKDPGTTIDTIRGSLLERAAFVTPGSSPPALALEQNDSLALDRLLACLVERKILTRTPTVEELRRLDPTLLQKLGKVRVDPSIFRYSVKQKLTDAEDRVSTVAQRLSILSGFWRYLIARSGENTAPEQSPLLKYNIWTDPLATALKGVSSHQKAVRIETTPDTEVLDTLLETARGTTFKALRDRAMLLFLRWTGVRADELGHLKRKDLASDPPLITVFGKGGKTRSFLVPPEAVTAIRAMEAKVMELARLAPLPKDGPEPRIHTLLRPEAPLFPPLKHWGCNARSRRAEEGAGLSRPAISMMLRRRARMANIPEDSAAFRKIHPHGLRHLAALSALDSGVPINVIQGVLGHASIATTGRYTEQRDSMRLSLGTPVAPSPAGSPAVASPTQPRPAPDAPVGVARRRVVDTQAEVHVPTVPISAARTPPAPPGEAQQSLAASATSPTPQATPAAITAVVRRRVVGTTVAPREPAPPATVPAGERIVALGTLAPLARPTPGTEEIAARDQELLANAYTSVNWGGGNASAGGRERFHKEKTEAVGAEGEDASEDLLTHAYRGRELGLPWWGGPSGSLKPAMPVMAPAQILASDDPTSVVHGLERLWASWVEETIEGPGGKPLARGPTAARALLQWFAQSLEIMSQVEQDRVRRKAVWVPFSASVDQTAVAKGEAWTTLRVHLDGKVVLWFEARGFTFMAAQGREGRRVGKAIDRTVGEEFRPAVDLRAKTADLVGFPWFDSPDPVAELPQEDREELFDWLAALTGLEPKSPVKRFPRSPEGSDLALTRSDLDKLLGAMCSYDGNDDEIDRLQRGGMSREVRELIDQEKISRKASEDATKKIVARLTGGAVAGFDYAAVATARAKKQRELQERGAIEKQRVERDGTPKAEKKADDEETQRREMRRDVYMNVLRQLFGESAGADPILAIRALCTKAPLYGKSLPVGGDYNKLFTPGPGRTTIVHDKAFAKEFARATGTHSECVARRIARLLWELKRGRGEEFRNRADEIASLIDTWAYFAVPCPAPLETELKDRLVGAPVTPLRTAVEREQERIREGKHVPLSEEQAFKERLRLGAAAGRVAGLGYGGEFGSENLAEGGGYHVLKKNGGPGHGMVKSLGRYLKNATQHVPSPLRILVWVYTR